MSYIKKIYTFGTSFTKGGGFEFDVLHDNYIKLYEGLGEELKQSNFSWPGQLQKLLPNIEVINLAKSGFGNERIYRLATDLILSDNFNKEETLFLIEFSDIGRKEYYSRKLKDFIIVNYGQSKLDNFARTYKQKKKLSDLDLEKLPDRSYFENLVDRSLNDDVQLELMHFNNIKFLSILNNRKINYVLVQPPMPFPPNINLDNYNLNKFKISTIPPGGIIGEIPELTITKETNGIYEDSHFGLIGAKYISSKIHDDLINKGFIKSTLLNKNLEDFDNIKKQINLNIGNLI